MAQNLGIMSGSMFAQGTFLNSTPIVVPCISLGLNFSFWLRFAVLTTQNIEYSIDGV